MFDVNSDESHEAARRRLIEISIYLQKSGMDPPAVASAFLTAGMGVLLGMGDEVTLRWLRKAIDELENQRESVH